MYTYTFDQTHAPFGHSGSGIDLRYIAQHFVDVATGVHPARFKGKNARYATVYEDGDKVYIQEDVELDDKGRILVFYASDYPPETNGKVVAQRDAGRETKMAPRHMALVILSNDQYIRVKGYKPLYWTNGRMVSLAPNAPEKPPATNKKI